MVEIIDTISGPVDFALIVFDGNEISSNVAPALIDLQRSGTVRVIDAAFVTKDTDGASRYIELGDAEVGQAYAELRTHHLDLLNDEDLDDLADGLEPGSSGLIIVWENTWASRFAEAVRASRGRLAAFERVPHEQVRTALTAAVDEVNGER